MPAPNPSFIVDLLPPDVSSCLSEEEDVKDWTIDVITDALTRAEECAKRGSN